MRIEGEKIGGCLYGPEMLEDKKANSEMAAAKGNERFSFRSVEHTADYCLEIEGCTIEDLFRGAALGMMQAICGLPNGPEREMEVVVCGRDDEELLVAWLNELLFLWEESGVWLYDIPKLERQGDRLSARIRFARWVPGAAGDVEVAIKAATYSGLRIEKRENMFYARVTFDT